MAFKFEKLEVWQLALDYLNMMYRVADQLPKHEEHNLKSQIARAGTSAVLNIAEGSTGQTDAEQARFLGLAMRSVIETVACQHIINQRNYLPDKALLRQAYMDANRLVAKLQRMRTSIVPKMSWIREEASIYNGDTAGTPDLTSNDLIGDEQIPF